MSRGAGSPFRDAGTDGPSPFRPDPVLSVGLLVPEDREPGRDAAARTVLSSLLTECGRIAAEHGEFFSGAPARLRIVTRGPGGIVPPDGTEIVSLAVGAPAGPAADALVLPGTPEEPDAQACLGDALLELCDLLLCRWDGRADARPGSTGSLVQQAVERGLPVLILPQEGEGVDVVDDPSELLLPPVAAALPRVRLGDNLDRVLARVFAPPSGREEQAALRDVLSERPRPRTFRPEYPALLLLAARPEAEAPGLSSRAEWERAAAVGATVSAAAGEAVARAAERHARIEALAAFYARRVRSGVVLRYVGPALGSLMIALIAVVAPEVGLAWLGVQAVVMTLTIAEATLAERGRWGERWLDYRSLAERLRCDRFLAPFAIGLGRLEADTRAEDPVWTRWCHGRLLRRDRPAGTVTPAIVEAAFRHLREVEIAGQVRYHAAASRRYRSLSRRLRLVARGSILTIVAASAILFALTSAGAPPGGLQALATALLITLPSLFLAARGLRSESAFDTAASRSDATREALLRLRDRIGQGPLDYRRLVQASQAAAAAMILETVDWRVGLQRSRIPYRASPAPDRPAVTPAARS